MKKNFQLYKSSAGSGKTYTLVKEYLKIVLRYPDRIRNILAITFTNAAATEMKERIIGELGKISALAGGDPEKLIQYQLLSQISEELQDESIPAPDVQTLAGNAPRVLKSILHNYADFSVSTIDSFVYRIIRTFSFDLFLPFHFDVELDDEVLLALATQNLINRAGHDPELTEVLVAFIINQADEEKDLRIEKLISSMGARLTSEDADNALEALKGFTLKDLFNTSLKIKQWIRDFENRVQLIAGQAFRLTEQHGLDAGHFFQSRSNIHTYFQQLALGHIADSIVPNSYVRKTIEEGKWTSTKAGPAEQASIEIIRRELTQAFRSITGQDYAFVARYKSCLAVAKHIFPVAILNELDRELEGVKTENIVLHISDFNKKISAIVSEQPVPFIYERLGERYLHYMIDEFQDTSLLQWQNLLPLVDNALASGHMSLVVGDAKQAIYRFRNGDVEQFASLPKLSPAIQAAARPEWEQSLMANCQSKNLETNFRSQQQIITFNNRLFRYASKHLAPRLQSIYSNVEQTGQPSKPRGYVEIRFIETQSRSGKDDPGHDFMQASLTALTEVVKKVLDSGYSRRDITILCRANTEASLAARHLLENEIPVISSESLLLNQSDEVNFIIAFMKILVNPFDQIAAVELIAFLYDQAWLKSYDSLHECLKEAGLFEPGKKEIPDPVLPGLIQLFSNSHIPLSFHDFQYTNLYDTCEHIIRVFFTGKSRPNPFVAFFSDAIFDYSEKNTSSIHDFLKWWEENSGKYSLVLPDGVDAVRIMTIHKSKGLQFPVVIVPFADHSFSRTTKSGQWVDVDLEMATELKKTWIGLNKKELEGTPYEPLQINETEKSYLDALNLMYVAFTRAKDQLYVLPKTAKQYNSNTTHGLLQQFLKEESLWQDGLLRYTFGTPGVLPSSGLKDSASERIKEAGTGQQDDGIFFNTIPSQSWNGVLRMKSHQLERNTDSTRQDRLERGNLLHRAMEQIRSAGDIHKVLLQFHENGEIDATLMDEWEEKINRLITLPEVASCFSGSHTIKSEAGIFDANGQFYRPDRVVLTENETIVIDYKTGKQYTRHLDQMNTYGELLQEMGYPQIKKMILYLDENKIKTV